MLPDKLLWVIDSLMDYFSRKHQNLLLYHVMAFGDHLVIFWREGRLRTETTNHAIQVIKLVQKNLYQAHGNIGEAETHKPDFALCQDAYFVHNQPKKLLMLWIHVDQVSDKYFAKSFEELFVMGSFLFNWQELGIFPVDQCFSLA